MNNNNIKRHTGFTIIETMITVSLFIIITTIGLNSLLNANLLHQKSRDMRSIMDNLSFIMEDISTNLRTGYDYRCFETSDTIAIGIPKDCVSGGWAIAFKPQSYPEDSQEWVYKTETNSIDSSKFNILKSTDSGATFIQLNPNEVGLDSSDIFTVIGAEPPPDHQQPFVTIKLTGKITFKNVDTPFSLQTSISQRNIDI